MSNLIEIAGLLLSPQYVEICDEFVTINGVNSPLQDWQIKDYQVNRLLGHNITTEQKRDRNYCINMWSVLTKLRPFMLHPTTDLGFMYKIYLYNDKVYDVCFYHNNLFSITKYTYEPTTKF